jgi:uncharacterized protein YjbJ (UPF0337 family)
MLTPTPTSNEIETESSAPASVPFSKTASAAKMSGTYNEAAGFIKRTMGRLSENLALEDAGKNQQLIGKVHRLVGSLRSAHHDVLQRLNRTRLESQAVFREHGGRLLDGTSELVDEIKKIFLK